ncbi:subclass B3 metallo-beta-lactamase [Ferruginibacter sp. SUN106]|uniref:subclass B3 metallo-beta-lactamase n=1 Tax=Ferruginibacter sp. SUN106 TaxID=2978348 RepID=UPI003D36FFBC
MFTHALKNVLLVIAVVATTTATAQKVIEPPLTRPEWVQPCEPFRIAGNLYYVGTYDLACYLITTKKGNILINTGLASSDTMIKKNVEALGFKFSRIKILLNTQAHYDHMGAMAAIKKQTKARLMIDEKDAEVAEDGGSSDYALGARQSTYQPVKPDRLLHDSDIIKLGNMQLMLLHHPGHTKGSCSFLFTVKDEQQSYKVLIANMPTIVTDSAFSHLSTYPEIANDYAYTLKGMKNISFDIWVTSHASQCNLHDKHKPGDAYNPAAFKDQAGYDAALKDLQKDYDEKMKQEKKMNN